MSQPLMIFLVLVGCFSWFMIGFVVGRYCGTIREPEPGSPDDNVRFLRNLQDQLTTLREGLERRAS